MLSSQEKSQIKQLMQSPSWSVVENLAKRTIEDIEGESTVSDDQWSTLKDTVLKEGKVRGIREFIQKFYENAQ